MEEIRVSEISCSVYDYPMMEYACDECGARFIDRDENYQYCPHCGRKIVDEWQQAELKEAAQLIKAMCSKRKRCKGCIFHDVDSASPCKVTNWPDEWEVD